MKAAEHTERMIQGWARLQIHRADLAIRRQDGAMIWQRGRPLDGLPLGWAKAENAHGAEVYIRPERGSDWPLVFLDDVPVACARHLSLDYGAMVVQTSLDGRCHIWLPCDRSLDERSRGQLQRSLTEQFCADKASVSGEHLGRLAGFKNWKRGGCWVNVLCDLDGSRRYAVPQRVLTGQHVERPPSVTSPPASPGGPPAKIRTGDVSPSGLEWGWVCRLLEMGQDPDRVYHMLVNRAADRRGEDVERYARRTVEKALERVRRAL